MTRVVGIALGALTASYVVVALLLDDGAAVKELFRSYVHSGLMAGAAVLGLRAAIRSERERVAWTAMAVGLVAFACGEITWRFVYADDAAPPYPSVADGFWLLTYPAFYVGIMSLLRARIATLAVGSWLDGLIAAVVTMAAGLAFYVQPVLDATQGDPIAVGVTMAYPLGGLLLVALLVAVVALAGAQLSRASLLLCLGLIAVTVGDGFYALGTAEGTYIEGRWPDTLWPAGVLLIAWAGLLRAPARRPVHLRGWRALALPTTLALAGIAMEIVGDMAAVPLATSILTKIAFVLVVVRVVLTIRENLALVERTQLQATRDELTGLRNRRALLADLEDLHARGPVAQHALTLFDLDGFKAYNDAFGHPAGDALLARLGGALAAATPGARVYRLGGDEFCVLATGDVVAAADAALTLDGDGFAITASHGTARLPEEAESAPEALKLADERMYRHKARRSAGARRAALSRHVVIARLGAGLDPAVVAQFGAPAEQQRAA